MPTLRLTGPRVVLRPLELADRPTMARILAEPDVARWWIHEDLEAAVAGLYDDEDAVRFAIEVDGAVIGFIQFAEVLEPDYMQASIDLFLSTAWQGRGFGPEAIRVVAGHLFDERGHHRITLDPAADNEHGIRAYEKVGFRPVGIMRQYERSVDLTWHDGLLMDLLRGELR